MSAYTSQAAGQIVEELIDEMTGRAGLDAAWESLDEETREALTDAWTEIVKKHLDRMIET